MTPTRHPSKNFVGDPLRNSSTTAFRYPSYPVFYRMARSVAAYTPNMHFVGVSVRQLLNNSLRVALLL